MQEESSTPKTQKMPALVNHFMFTPLDGLYGQRLQLHNVLFYIMFYI